LFVIWCVEHELVPLAAVRTDIERDIRWMQEVRRFTATRRSSLVPRSSARTS
jgi:hypothetical protein